MSSNLTPFTNINGAAPGADRASAHPDALGCVHVVRFRGRTLIPQAPPAPAPAPPPPPTPAEHEKRLRTACDALRSSGHVRMTSEATRDAEGNVLGMLVVCKYCNGDVYLEGQEHEFERLILLHVRACETPGAQTAYARALEGDKENCA